MRVQTVSERLSFPSVREFPVALFFTHSANKFVIRPNSIFFIKGRKVFAAWALERNEHRVDVDERPRPQLGGRHESAQVHPTRQDAVAA